MSLLLLHLLDCFDNFSIVIHANNVNEVAVDVAAADDDDDNDEVLYDSAGHTYTHFIPLAIKMLMAISFLLISCFACAANKKKKEKQQQQQQQEQQRGRSLKLLAVIKSPAHAAYVC